MICIDFGSKIVKAALCRFDNALQRNSVQIMCFNACAYIDSYGFNLSSADDAKQRLHMDDSVACCNDFKKNLGSNQPIAFVKRDGGLQSFSAMDVTGEFLQTIRKSYEAQKCSLNELQSLAITVPQNFSPAQKYALKEAAKFAGFEKVFMFTESETIAACFKENASKKSHKVLVVDWGHSALKLSLLRKNAHGKYVSTSFHRSFKSCGGVIFRDMLASYVINETSISDEDICDDPQLCIQIIHAAETAQESMNAGNGAFSIRVEGKSAKFLCSLSVDVYQNILRKFTDIGKKCINEFINSLLEDKTTESVILSGGVFQHESVKSAVKSLFVNSIVWNSTHPSDDALRGLTFLATQECADKTR